jgi:hypothetical protein
LVRGLRHTAVPAARAGIVQYVDFGRIHAGSGSIGGQGGITAVDAKAGTLFALGYLPLPVPFLDVYGKVGVARLHETTTEIGSLAIRAEYERIGAGGENPSFASLGVTWTF